MIEKLDKFYNARAVLPDIMSEEEWNKKEMEFIREHLEPQIRQQMEKLLQGVKSPLSINIEYDTDGKVSVELSRKSKHEEEEEEPDNNESHRIHRSESVGFTVYFPDGTIIKRNKAKDTFVAALKAIGLNIVAAFRGRSFSGLPLVSKTRRYGGEKKWQVKVDGWYIYVQMSNKVKVDVLQMISNEFKLGLIIKTEDSTSKEETNNTHPIGKRQMYTLDGAGPFNKRTCVLETIKKYMKLHPYASSKQLQRDFPEELQGSYGVVRPIEWVQQKQHGGKDFFNRYFISTDKVINTSDGEQMVVCNQWGDNFSRFIEAAHLLGFEIKEKTEQNKLMQE